MKVAFCWFVFYDCIMPRDFILHRQFYDNLRRSFNITFMVPCIVTLY